MNTVLGTRKSNSMPAFLTTGLATILLLPGCASRGDVDALEAKLRAQDQRIRSYTTQVSQLENDLKISQRELDLVRSASAQTNTLASYEEISSQLARAESVSFHSFLTAAQNLDGVAGDEQFFALISPYDAQGSVVKLSGDLQVEAIDPARPSNDRTIGIWNYSSEKSRDLWFSGFLSSGYQIQEKWDRLPMGEKVILIAKLKTLDGRTFETTYTLSVDPAGHSQRAAPPQNTSKATDQVTKKTAPTAITPVSDLTVPSLHGEGETRLVPDPEPWEFETKSVPKPDAPRRTARPGTAVPQPTVKEFPATTKGALSTSDNWTEETIPVLR